MELGVRIDKVIFDFILKSKQDVYRKSNELISIDMCNVVNLNTWVPVGVTLIRPVNIVFKIK